MSAGPWWAYGIVIAGGAIPMFWKRPVARIISIIVTIGGIVIVAVY